MKSLFGRFRRGEPVAGRGEEARPPITVVSGLPRSGTSMMMRVLEAAGLDVLQDQDRAADGANPGGFLINVTWRDRDTGNLKSQQWAVEP